MAERIKSLHDIVGKTVSAVTDLPADEFKLFYKMIRFSDGSSMEVHPSCCFSEGRMLQEYQEQRQEQTSAKR